MSVQRRQPNDRLSYNDDIILFETAHFISIINHNQGRSHLIIRSKREIEKDFPFDLYTFNIDFQDEFWYLVQKTVAKSQIPTFLCHHFGEWRSADHFHVHLVVNNAQFAKFVAKESPKPIDEANVISKINKKSEYLVIRQMKFQNEELEVIRNMKITSEDQFPTEWEDYYIEIHPYFSRVSFIPKAPLMYSQDSKVVNEQLKTYRTNVFKAMRAFADKYGLKNYRTWQKLSGDPFYINHERPTDRLIYGLIQVSPIDFFRLHSNREEWLENWKKADKHPLNLNKFPVDPLSCI